MSNVTKVAMNGLMDGAYGVGGKVAAKAVAGMLGMNTGVTGYLVEAVAGIAGGILVSGFSKEGARAFVQGAFMGPIEELVKGANIPLVSSQLSGYNNTVVPTAYNAGLLGPGAAVGMQGYPPAFAGYPPQGMVMGDFETVAENYGR